MNTKQIQKGQTAWIEFINDHGSRTSEWAIISEVIANSNEGVIVKAMVKRSSFNSRITTNDFWIEKIGVFDKMIGDGQIDEIPTQRQSV